MAIENPPKVGRPRSNQSSNICPMTGVPIINGTRTTQYHPCGDTVIDTTQIQHYKSLGYEVKHNSTTGAYDMTISQAKWAEREKGNRERAVKRLKDTDNERRKVAAGDETFEYSATNEYGRIQDMPLTGQELLDSDE